MAQSRARHRSLVSRYSSRKTFSDRRSARVRLQYELLEPRHLLAAEIGLTPAGITGQQNVSPAPITWFETISGAERVPLKSLASVDRLLPDGVAGPIPMAAGEWIVQLGDEAAVSVRKLADADALLDDLNNNFTIISGLGSRGALLLRADGPSRSDIESSLRTNPHVQSYQLNQLIQGQATTPNESDFAAGLLPGLTKINAEAAWDESIGSMSTVVGVVDSGIDPTHPDLYLNIWINQGEIPSEFLDDGGNKLVDIDGDGLITFYDLNHATREAMAPYALTVAGFANGPNAEFVRDLNNNSRIDADDLLRDARWTSGTDDDGNGFFDDIFGVNFRAGAGDPFASNNPTDELGHGTHVAGTIGAIGSNNTGVVGVNWQTSLMSLRILDNNNQGDSGAAIRAINYARDMRERLTINSSNRVTEGASVKILNNSWGQPGGYEASLESAIQQLYEANILFVAAAGNGNILGNGVDNDRTPFYPASYDAPNVIAVAAADANDRLATFSNFGKTSVDLLAPGVGIRSTLPGGGYQSANGTSMAAPHVAGTAALIWSAVPEATVDEVKQAILSTVTPVSSASNVISTTGRLNTNAAITTDIYAPAARLVAKQNITTAGGTTTEFTVEYSHPSRIDKSTLGNDDLVVTRQWGPADQFPAVLKPGSVIETATTTTATYVMDAPGNGVFESQAPIEIRDAESREFTNTLPVTINNARPRVFTNTVPIAIGNSHLFTNTEDVLIDANSVNTVTSEIGVENIPDSASELTVSIEIEHSYTADLTVTLIAPNGSRAVLVSLVGGSGANFQQTVFSDSAAASISVGSAPFTGIFRPAENINALVAAGTNGIWMLEVSDTAGGDGGALKQWALNFSPEATIVVDGFFQPIAEFTVSVDIEHDSVENLTATLIAPDGSRAVLFSNVGGSSANFQETIFDDNASLTIADGAGPFTGTYRPAESISALIAAGVNGVWSLEVTDNGLLQSGTVLGWALNLKPSPVTAASEMIVKDVGAIGDASDFMVSVDIDHDSVKDLTATLIAPDGSRAVLFSNVDGSTANFQGTVFNDNATTSIVDGTAPFTGTFRSTESIAALLASGANGIWRLELEDNGLQEPGSLRNWSLNFPTLSTTRSQIVVDNIGNNFEELTVSVDIDHGSVKDLTATLIAPDGSRAVLFSNIGGSESNFTGTRFNDAAATLISDASAPLTGTFRPSESISSLLLPNADGVWTLELVDSSISQSGSLVAWSLNFTREWDPLHFGEYIISTVAGKVLAGISAEPIESREVDSFNVRIEDPSVVYVSTHTDSLEAGSLRSAIIEANAAAPAARTIILDAGKYTIDIPSVVDPASTFGTSLTTLEIENPGGWSNSTTGDFDIQGNVTIVGDTNDDTVIDARGLDRVFKVHQNAGLGLTRLTIQGGVSPESQGGGGILSIGDLTLTQVIAKKNTAIGSDAARPLFGGAIAAWAGNVSLNESWITENRSDFGGGIYLGHTASGTVQRSTVDTNVGGGLYSTSTSDAAVGNSTFSANSGGYGAIANGNLSEFFFANEQSYEPSLSADGRFVTFWSDASNLVPGDTRNIRDIFVYDTVTKKFQRVSISDASVEGNNVSGSPSLSADGRYVTFESFASNLVPGDTNNSSDIFVYDTETEKIQRVSVSDAGVEGNSGSFSPSQSADGRYVTFSSAASNLVPGDTNNSSDIFVYDTVTKKIQRVSVSDTGVEGNSASDSSSLSADGRFVTFNSEASNLVPGDTNNSSDIFIYDTVTKKIQRVSVSDAGVEGNSGSGSPSLSADGRYVTFAADASNLVPGDTNNSSDIFVYDTVSKKIQRVSVSDAGVEGNSYSYFSSLSADGRFVTFTSFASNLVPGDTNNSRDMFVYDTETEKIQRVSVSDAGAEGNSFSYFPSQSANGRYVTFATNAWGDSTISNIVVFDTWTKSIEPVTFVAAKSVVNVFHTTVAYTANPSVNAAVFGHVRMNDSLVVANQVARDLLLFDALPTAPNTLSSTPNAERITPLQRSGTHPPVHHLVFGNPAINSASPVGNERRDQLSQVRARADNGAVEAISAMISGNVYVDTNRDGRLNAGEAGIPGVEVMFNSTSVNANLIVSRIDDPRTPQKDESGVLEVVGLPPGTYKFTPQPIAGWSVTQSPLDMIANGSILGKDGSTSPSISADGRYVTFSSDTSNLVPGDNNRKSDVFIYDTVTKRIERVSVSDGGVEGDNASQTPSLSADGRYVTFESDASNLVARGFNSSTDIFVYDTVTKKIQQASVSDAGVEGNDSSRSPSLSADGRYVTFSSFASNLVPGDTNNSSDIFIYDTVTKKIQRVSVSDAGIEGNFNSYSPSLSADGRYVTFASNADDLVPGDTNNSSDIFVYDTVSRKIQRVSVSDAGIEGNFNSNSPSLSADGRYVTFSSFASNLVPGDTNNSEDIFVYDTETEKIQRVSVSDAGVEGNSYSYFSSLSADGRFVTFTSFASNLVPGDTNNSEDIFVYDTEMEKIQRVSVSDAGVEGNSVSNSPSLSADGRYATFASYSNNLVPRDNNGAPDIFIVPNPLNLQGIVTRNLQAGEVFTSLHFGLVPDPGTISGRVFEDTIENGVFDSGEPGFVGALVFLDLNNDRLFDEGEPFVTTDSEGNYRFLDTDSFRSYSVVVRVPIGFEPIAPGADQQFAWNIFLPAGGIITDRDFAIRRVQSTGQSNASAISGRLYEDKNGNGMFDVGVDIPVEEKEVFLDTSNFGVRDTNELRTLTDTEGRYSFAGLNSGNVAVTTLLNETLVHVNPLGSDFALENFPLFGAVTPFGNPQAIASGDFNQDGFLDVAVALGEANKLSIRLNDGMGGFLPEEIDIDLGTTGAGPTSLVVGQFDNDTKLDVALTANFTGNVTILRNFDPVTKSFQPPAYVKVGDEPLEIAAGQLGGDAKLDLVVVNKAGNTVQVLTNNGSGVFTAGPGVPTGGRNSSSIVVGNFTGDASLDVAVVHASPLTTANPFGGVTLLRGDDAGGLTLDTGYYTVGATPTDAVVGDFNKDGRPDIAVSNFATNSISILLGQADGTMRVQTDILGTASGAFDITAGDIDNDGDIDVIASNLQDRNISIFRNIGVIGGDVQFEPLENVGLGQFTLAQRMPLLVGNFDRDTSGPGGMGTIDIVTIPQRTDTLHVLTNTLVNGAHRVALTGLNVVSGRDFIIKPAILPPFFDPIADPPAVVEGSAQQAVLIRGIQPGRAGGPPLQFSATSSNRSLIASPSVAHSADGTTATVRYTPLQNANGSSLITVRATDAGADGIFDTADDGILTRSFTVTVLAVNDRIAPSVTLSTDEPSPTLNVRFKVIAQFSEPVVGLVIENVQVSGGQVERIDNLGNGRFELAIAATSGSVAISLPEAATHDLAGNSSLASMMLRLSVGDRLAVLAPTSSGQSIDLTSMSDSELLDVETIDLRGFGDNLLTLDSAKVQSLFADASVTIYADPGDTIAFDGDWLFGGIELIDGAIHKIFLKSGATIFVNGPLDYTNPQNRFDVDGSGEVVALDGLVVLTTIRNKRLASANGIFLPMTTENQSQYRFVDVNRDNLVTPLDALLVLNEVRRQGREGSGGSGEQVVVVPMQNAPLIAMATSSSSTRTEDRNATTPELVTYADASQNPAKAVSHGPQQWQVDTIPVNDDKHDEQNDRMSLIDEAFADPLLLNW